MGCILIIFIELFMLWCFFNYVFSEEPDTKIFDGTEWGLYREQIRRQTVAQRHLQVQLQGATADNMSRYRNGSNTFEHRVAARHRRSYGDTPGVKTIPIGIL